MEIKNSHGSTAPLSRGNAVMNDALKRAMGAIHLLDYAGATVHDIDIRGGTPVLRIDRPPPFVTGSVTVRRYVRGMHEVVRAAPYHGAQLEWTEQSPRPVSRISRIGAVQ